MPKIVAADGVNIIAKLDLLPNEAYPDAHTGQPFGRSPNQAVAGSSSTRDDSAVGSDRHGSTNIQVSQLYMNLVQEYGEFVVGRAPLEFGLGISHSAGNGAFDHWYSTRDMLAYKVVIGNFYLMPILGRVSDLSVAQGGDVQDVIWNAEYNNPETESAIGLMHQTRTSGDLANDAAAGSYGGQSVTAGRKTQHVNLFFSRGFESVKYRVEAGFESGSTGVSRTVGSGTEQVNLNGYGIAFEAEVPRKEGPLSYLFRAGVASGDNPSTTNDEGFYFHRNYDVAFLLFNHPMGRYDLMRSQAQRSPDRLTCTTAPCAPYSTDEALDDEAISNALFIAPRITYRLSDKWDWNNTLTWAQLQTNPLSDLADDVSRDLGIEWDTALVYRPTEKFSWVNELGLLSPGAAWAGGSNNFAKGFTYGISSKLAVSF
jgi:hypothetical protein